MLVSLAFCCAQSVTFVPTKMRWGKGQRPPGVTIYIPMKTYKFCQSCGYPMKKDKQGGGTEKDGSHSAMYCSMCYENGRFLSPAEVDTAEKMQRFCIAQMKKSGMNGLLAWLATRTIPRLERWKKKEA